MKRYNMRDVTPYVTVHPDGEWVRYSDHVEAMKRIAGDSAQAEPVAWMHVMDNTEGIPTNEPWVAITQSPKNPFGVPGEDYSKTFPVTSAPLYAAPAPSASPAAESTDDVWPIVNITVNESGDVTAAKLYAPGLPAGNHDVYPVRVPYMDEHTEAWMAVAKALEQVAPGYLDGSGNGIECAVKAIHRLAAPAASPAALTVEREAFEAWVREELQFDGEDGDPCKRGQCGYLESNVDSAWCAWQARALLAASPADQGEDARDD